ncbi:MAG: acetate--CoA ligase family protein [Hyphomicrobiales bacterium]|nr:acetate--CoA ligase family protein [Hyphomicrobiales bacterium]
MIDPERLTPLLAPRSIAFVGASARPDTPGNSMLKLIRKGGFNGKVTAVNPSYREVEGYACVPSINDLSEVPDLVVFSVKNERIEESLAAAAEVGARAAVIFASGILSDDHGPPLMQRLRKNADAAGIAVCGPNCMGYYNELDQVWIGGFMSPRQPEPGTIALIAHSGSVFGSLAHNDARLRYALAISPGGELNVTAADYIAYSVSRPEVRVIGVFMETARDPAGFAQALELAAAKGIPVVVLKVGRTEGAAAAALTHTGALAGSDLAYQALFDRYGVIRVETLDELAATLLLLASPRHAGPGGLVAIGDSGGERGMLIDLANRAGVGFAPLAEKTRARIQSRLDPGLEAVNPLDAWGTGADFVPLFTDCLIDLMADESASIGLFSADLRDHYYVHRGFADAALAAAKATSKPIAFATNYTQVRHDHIALELTRAGLPVLDGTSQALAAVRGALQYRDFLARPADRLPPRPTEEVPYLGNEPLDEAASLALLSRWGVPIFPHAVCDSLEAVRAAAERFGYPLVCKTAMAGILHKSDVDGVKLGLTDGVALECAYADLKERLGPRVLVAPMTEKAVEIALGMVKDPQFGAIVTVGAGGTLVELIDDRAAALAPFGPATARRLIDGLKLHRLLCGYRGAARVDLDRLAAIVSAFSAMAATLCDQIAEIDVNPLVAGRDIFALDALIVPMKEQ